MAILKRGSSGPDVTELQHRLKELAYGPLEADGKFGPNTESALIAFQKLWGLTADGNAGPATMVALQSASSAGKAPFTSSGSGAEANAARTDSASSAGTTASGASASNLHLAALAAILPPSVIAQIPETAQKSGITTNLRLAHFLTQCAFESNQFSITEEKLDYAATRLAAIFPKFFKGADPAAYAHNPAKTANRIYANRMGNGDEASGDGYKFRGRGYILLTGRNNYTAFSTFIGKDCVARPDLVATTYPLASAGFFFKANNIWAVCDRGADDASVLAVSTSVNGMPAHSSRERISYFRRFFNVLNVKTEHVVADSSPSASASAHAEELNARASIENPPVSKAVRSSKKTKPGLQFRITEFQKRLTTSSRTALEHAEGIGKALKQPTMHMEHLIAGLFQKADGPTRREFVRAGINQHRLVQIVEEKLGTVLPAESAYTPVIGRNLTGASSHVRQAFRAATAMADSHESEVIRSRHLIRGALSVSECSLIQALISQGVDPEKILIDGDPLPAPSPRRPTQAGIRSDDPEGDDLLDIKAEVEALCTVLASKKVKPPISLGLFGDWGSGKSFFMKKMEERFKKLAETARTEESAYCGNIVQLWFNAWHYMDTNLWASLATAIFDELAQELARQDAVAAGIDPDYERAKLVDLKSKAKEKVAEAEQLKRDADAKLRRTQQQLASIQSGETEVAMSPRAFLREGYRFAVQQPDVRQKIKKAEETLNKQFEEAAKELNINQDPESIKEQLLEVKGIWVYARAIALAVRHAKNKRRLILMLIGFLVVSLALLWLLPMLLLQPWIQSTWFRLSSVGVAVLTFISPFLPALRRAAQIIHDAIKANQDSIETARRQAEEHLQMDHEKFRQQAVVAQETLDRETGIAKDLAEKLDALRSDRKMSNFIRQRQQSSDYTKYLGVIAKARNDFEQLSTLLAKEQERSAKEQKEQRRKKRTATETRVLAAMPEAQEQQGLLPPIDRIILYIDDLDRCPENKVVDVLQAVHLLLAFPLFVVVVGVDPRWLLHSLRQHSKAFQDQVEDDDSSEEERTQWRSTPLNYLEKIFQIPFTLNPMGRAGFGNMIDTLTEPPKAEQSDEEPEELENTEQPLPEVKDKPEMAAAADAVQLPVGDEVAAEPPVEAAPIAEKSWPARLLHYLKHIFQSTTEIAEPVVKNEVGEEPPAMDAIGNEVTKPQPDEAAPENSSTSQETQTTVGKPVSQPEEIDPHPEYLLISPWEKKFMKELHELVPSPRATKRFINIYRLIRAAVDLDERQMLDEFTNEARGKYRPVLLLLAILTGYPEQATEILRELLEKKHPESWWEFVGSFKGRAEKRPTAQNGRGATKDNGAQLKASPVAKKPSRSKAPSVKVAELEPAANGKSDTEGSIDDRGVNGFTEAEIENWEQLLDKLENLHHLFAPSQSCADFVQWAPKVARYSFQSGRVLLSRSVRNSGPGNNPS